MKNEEIKIDICRTLVGKPSISSGTWNSRQFINEGSLKGSFNQAYEKYGWFGGYANLDVSADYNSRFVNSLLGSLRSQCLRFEVCIC